MDEKAPPPVAWDQPATLIDLDGTAPFIGPLDDCARHFHALKPSAQADARILLTQPIPRLDRRTRTWLIGPDRIVAFGPPPERG